MHAFGVGGASRDLEISQIRRLVWGPDIQDINIWGSCIEAPLCMKLPPGHNGQVQVAGWRLCADFS